MIDNDAPWAHGFAVSHAQGIVMAQAQCTFGDAFTMMNDRAQMQGVTVEEIANAVLERRIRFS
jgi:AmiR/NasT family two-component response regulator